MAQHGVPATPENYAVWYQYVTGENPSLKARIDLLIRNEQPFTHEINEALFHQYGEHCNLDKLMSFRATLHDLVGDVSDSLSQADKSVSRFGSNLMSFNSSIQTLTQLDELKGMLSALLTETQEMQDRTGSLQQHLDAKNQEVQSLREELEQEKAKQALDPMTGLTNRTTFFDTLEDRIASDTPLGRLCLLMIDIDHFKAVNDNHGHLVGDRVIKFVAETIRQSIKGKDVAARFGGEEFVVLLPDTPFEGAAELARQLISTVAKAKLKRVDTQQPIGQITISIGLAVYRQQEEMLSFIERADKALYLSKKHGRNRLTTEKAING
jgi:diguanylate cyclase